MFDSKNTPTHFECEVDKLDYGTIESEISHYFDMGYPDNSNIPPEMDARSGGTYILVGTEKSGTFSINTYGLTNGKFQLSVSLQGKLHRC